MNKLELLSLSVRTIIQADYFTHVIQLPAILDFQNKKIWTVTLNKNRLSLNTEISESSFKFETGNFLRLTVLASVFGSLFSQI